MTEPKSQANIKTLNETVLVMGRKLSTHHHTELAEMRVGNLIERKFGKFTKIKCAYHSTSTEDGVTGTRLAISEKQTETVQNPSETSVFRCWTGL